VLELIGEVTSAGAVAETSDIERGARSRRHGCQGGQVAKEEWLGQCGLSRPNPGLISAVEDDAAECDWEKVSGDLSTEKTRGWADEFVGRRVKMCL
jgi:hypothetical protein